MVGQGGEIVTGCGGMGARLWEVSEAVKVKVEVLGRQGGRGRSFAREKDCVGGWSLDRRLQGEAPAPGPS